MYLQCGEHHHCWPLITEVDRREDMETNLTALQDWLSLFSPCFSSACLVLSLLSYSHHTRLMWRADDTLNNIFQGGYSRRWGHAVGKGPDQLYQWSHDWTHDRGNNAKELCAMNQTSGFKITDIKIFEMFLHKWHLLVSVYLQHM